MPDSLPVHIEPFKVSGGPGQQVVYPQVWGMADPSLQTFINQSIVRETQGLIDQQISDMADPIGQMVGEFEMKNNQRQILSLMLSNYAIHEMAAHGMTYLTSLTFDLETGKRCQLSDLFKPGSDYTSRISDMIKQQIKERGIQTLGEFTGIKPDQPFYIADKTLVIYFQLYELTPYVFGFPIFPLSVYELQDIIDENGPLSRMAINN
ncbi:DUF3298 and DUF4163 domain-containing protein [Lentibacillus juripiscarius]|uniref:DUF3298 domain-containing protein n=1 Tax=Lentibacillus juripiscarius TaxID=257446 RepID=A0ABW5V6C1_9BACI